MDNIFFNSTIINDESCDPKNSFKLNLFNIVIFGGSGDLSQRKLIPSLYNLYFNGLMGPEFKIYGFGKPSYNDKEYRDIVIKSIKKYNDSKYDDKKVIKFSKFFHYITADFDDKNAYESLINKLETTHNHIFYFAVPPKQSPIIINNLGNLNKNNKLKNSKLIMEKPFGTNKETANELNNKVLKYFDEKQVYRIDHYLGKETVQNILFFRFGNNIIEPIWNREYIDHIQITVAEDLGIGHRGKFYEESGVIRDIVQNHLLQLIALVAMEPPVGFNADFIRDEKVKVFRSIRKMDNKYIDNSIVLGQYILGELNNKNIKGYREEENVDTNSKVPTFFSSKFYIDNWRWAGVPFYVRTGKRLKRKITEIYVEFKHPPLKLFGSRCNNIKANSLIFRIQPHEEIIFNINIKQPGIGSYPSVANMLLNYETLFNKEKLSAYERLLIDCINSDLTLFARKDGIEEMWKIVDPIIKRYSETDNTPHSYRSGSWGPLESFLQIEKDNRKWRFDDE